MLSVDSCSCGTSPEDLEGWELLGWDPPSTEGVLDLELLGWDSLDFGLDRWILGLDGGLVGDLFLCLLLVLAIAASFSDSSAVSAVMYFFISFSSPNRKQTISSTHIQTCSEIIFDLPIASTVALYILLSLHLTERRLDPFTSEGMGSVTLFIGTILTSSSSVNLTTRCEAEAVSLRVRLTPCLEVRSCLEVETSSILL